MTQLQGFSEYKNEHYESSCFTALEKHGTETFFLLHGKKSITGAIEKQSMYDLYIRTSEGEVVVPKVDIKCHMAASSVDSSKKLIKQDKTVSAKALGPIHAPAARYFIKNKTLYPLIKERQVMLITLLEGEVIKGLMVNFSRYDLQVHMKGGVELTVLRHAVYDMRDKKGRCYLKSFQKKSRDWKQSSLYA